MPVLFSAFTRNGEDFFFYEPEFDQLAHRVLSADYTYRYELSSLGWHHFYIIKGYVLELVEESNGRGSGKLTVL